jgi:hypothetical protein
MPPAAPRLPDPLQFRSIPVITVSLEADHPFRSRKLIN